MKAQTYCIVEKTACSYSLITTVTGQKKARQQADEYQSIWTLKHWQDYQAMQKEEGSVGEYIRK